MLSIFHINSQFTVVFTRSFVKREQKFCLTIWQIHDSLFSIVNIFIPTLESNRKGTSFSDVHNRTPAWVRKGVNLTCPYEYLSFSSIQLSKMQRYMLSPLWCYLNISLRYYNLTGLWRSVITTLLYWFAVSCLCWKVKYIYCDFMNLCVVDILIEIA